MEPVDDPEPVPSSGAVVATFGFVVARETVHPTEVRRSMSRDVPETSLERSS